MGIRINKSIGYGLLDLNNCLDDPRLNLTSDRLDELHDYDVLNFLEFLKDKSCVDILISVFKENENDAKWNHEGVTSLDLKEFERKMGDNRGLHRALHMLDCDTEQDDDWIVFYPLDHIQPGYNCWKRHDDLIDYYENRVYREDLDNNIVDLSKKGVINIYPYSHGMRLKPGRENKVKEIMPKYFGEVSKKPNFIEGGHYNMLVGRWNGHKSNSLVTEDIYNHLIEDWAPFIPTTIKLFVYYYDILKDPLTVYDFKPMLCQWWA